MLGVVLPVGYMMFRTKRVPSSSGYSKQTDYLDRQRGVWPAWDLELTNRNTSCFVSCSNGLGNTTLQLADGVAYFPIPTPIFTLSFRCRLLNHHLDVLSRVQSRSSLVSCEAYFAEIVSCIHHPSSVRAHYPRMQEQAVVRSPNRSRPKAHEGLFRLNRLSFILS